MKTPEKVVKSIGDKIGKDGFTAFISALIWGLIAHMPALISDIPNHDGLSSMYFDQNMITSGRWFLGIACGISSYFSIPWMIGVLAVLYLSITVVLVIKLLKVKNSFFIILISGMMMTFPSLASNFAYVFTMDGYMLGLMLAVASVLLVEVHKLGFLFGGIALAFSMGIYQSYLPVAMLFALYEVWVAFAEGDKFSSKIKCSLRYLFMGGIGVSLYYLILKVLLVIEKKQLDTYQGIDGMTSFSFGTLLTSIKKIYEDFAGFTIFSKVLFANGFALAAYIILALVCVGCFAYRSVIKGWYKKVGFYIILVASIVLVPVFTNVILIISPQVNYHVLMRYQWVLFGVFAVAFIERVIVDASAGTECGKMAGTAIWMTVISLFVISFSYMITDNIAYTNLHKKYEKTYSYCLRLADRIEQTEGYYEGIPIYLIGIIGDESYPVTDITEKATSHLIGIGGDYLLYTGQNYELFFKHYMGITFNFLRPEEANYYFEDWYMAMPSFPAKDSVKVVDGVLVIKAENCNRD